MFETPASNNKVIQIATWGVCKSSANNEISGHQLLSFMAPPFRSVYMCMRYLVGLGQLHCDPADIRALLKVVASSQSYEDLYNVTKPWRVLLTAEHLFSVPCGVQTHPIRPSISQLCIAALPYLQKTHTIRQLVTAKI